MCAQWARLSPCSSQDCSTSCSPPHRDIIEIRGNNFGVNPLQYSISGVPTSAPAGFEKPIIHVCDRDVSALCDQCDRLHFNHTYISCRVPPGVGARKYIRVAVDGQENDPSEPGAQFAYHRPVIASLSSYSANTGPSVTGEQQFITITGKYFGSPSEQARLLATSPVAVTMMKYVAWTGALTAYVCECCDARPSLARRWHGDLRCWSCGVQGDDRG